MVNRVVVRHDMQTGKLFSGGVVSGTLLMIVLVVSGCGGTPHTLYESIQPELQHFTSTEIPLRFKDGMPYLTLETENNRFDIFLETGANLPTIALVPEVVDTLHVPTGGLHFVRSNYGVSVSRKFLLPEVKIGDITYCNVLCEQNKSQGPSPANESGILGLALLKEFNVLLDYQEAKMVLHRNDVYPVDDESTSWHKIPFLAHGHGILVNGRFKGSDQNLTFLLDTGAVARDERGEAFNPMKGSARAKLEPIPTADRQALVSVFRKFEGPSSRAAEIPTCSRGSLCLLPPRRQWHKTLRPL